MIRHTLKFIWKDLSKSVVLVSWVNFIKNTVNNDWDRSKKEVVQLFNPLIIEICSILPSEEIEPKVSEKTNLVFVEIKVNKLGVFSIRFLALVENQTVQVPELAYRKICKLSSLPSLLIIQKQLIT